LLQPFAESTEGIQGRIDAITKQQDNVVTKMQNLGKITIDIGKSIADTLADIAFGLASGTLKGFDILKTAGSAALRLVTDIFRQTLQQKLSFEVTLFNNLKGLPAQANAALATGAAQLPQGSPNTTFSLGPENIFGSFPGAAGGGGLGGLGGFLQSIIGLFGSNTPFSSVLGAGAGG